MNNDPYKVLGISEYSSEAEIKTAYRELVSRYMNSENKLAELNAAYDAIMNQRRGTGRAGYSEARTMISQGRFDDADRLLTALDSSTAEWNFLMGSVCYGKGWLNDAHMYFSKAVNLEPSNQEYNAALNRMNEQKSGYMNGSAQAGYNSVGRKEACGLCDCCQCLICTDCCCECGGGDCISCC